MERRGIPLAEVVADSLRHSLKMGAFRCGDRLAESVIAREMAVSQTTARDALAILEREGWVVKLAHRGYKVRKFKSDEVRETYVLRATLVSLALDWALEGMATSDEIMLSAIISDARLHAGVNNWNGFLEAIFGFQDTIVAIAGMTQTAQMLAVLRNQCWLLENLRAQHTPLDADSYANIVTEYGGLLTRIRYRERKAATNTIYDIIIAEGRSLLPVVDLLR